MGWLGHIGSWTSGPASEWPADLADGDRGTREVPFPILPQTGASPRTIKGHRAGSGGMAGSPHERKPLARGGWAWARLISASVRPPRNKGSVTVICPMVGEVLRP